MSFFSELKRRNVFKVGAAYLVVAWLLIQIADVVFPAATLPAWTVTFVTLLLALGLPVALLLAWAYEVTPTGIQKTRQVPLEAAIKRGGNQALSTVVLALLVLAVSVMAIDNYILGDRSDLSSTDEVARADLTAMAPDSSTVEPEIDRLPNSVAVLPFENMSANPEYGYFAAGMHNEILTRLQKIRNLNVIARTSVMAFAGAARPVEEIARELNVEAVMEGSVNYSGERVVVRVQLVDGNSGIGMWSESYNRAIADVFAVQADIAMNIANELEAEFSDEEQEELAEVLTNSSAAYALFMRARTLEPDSLELAIRELDRAIALDPRFAAAYAEKALRLANRGRLNPAVDAERERLARESANRALELDSSLGVAHAALGALHVFNGRWRDAQREFDLAYQLNPNDVFALVSYGTFRRDVGDYLGAIELLRRAVELDPNDPNVHSQLSISLRRAGDFSAALAEHRRQIALTPGSPDAHANLAYTLIANGGNEEGLAMLQTAEQLWGSSVPPNRLAQLAYAYSRTGRQQDVDRLLNRLSEVDQTSDVPEGQWALAHLAAGDLDEALRYLREVVRDPAGQGIVGQIKGNDYRDPILERPEWRALRDQMGRL